ncbi:uncharacterized protein BDW43DRAFT_186915 [Aspergillus alliaceus]|uniref:uncharacterized protein n=1 Tax=Petromyces alliaceus TaxID=209559 RepID=UPI0012A3EAC2|nr:uncharacterized protein BDW43DRAFT_186915 [Aspergillus alliaceus]KAB8229589.1 hypothetical protein BDW43DRAFT_186915 [Aspergillus alliaceus]
MLLRVLMGWYAKHAGKFGPLLPKSLRELVLRVNISLYDFSWEENREIGLLYRFLTDVGTYTPVLGRDRHAAMDPESHRAFLALRTMGGGIASCMSGGGPDFEPGCG